MLSGEVKGRKSVRCPSGRVMVLGEGWCCRSGVVEKERRVEEMMCRK